MQLTGRGPITNRGYGRPGVGDKVLSDGYEYIGRTTAPEPYPELGQAVRDAHAAEVLAASERLGTTDPGVLADALYLHPFNVARALRAAGLGDPTPPLSRAAAHRAGNHELLAAVAAYLRRQRRPRTTAEIAAGVGAHTTPLARLLRKFPDTVRMTGYGKKLPAGGKPPLLWELRRPAKATESGRAG